MSTMRQELEASARKVFPDWQSAADGDQAWATMAELGWFMAGVPEDQGGLGLGQADLAAIWWELGRALVPGAAVAQIAAIEALASCPAFDGRDALLEAAMAGDPVALSLDPQATHSAVPSADQARHLLVCAPGKLTLVPLEGAALTHAETWDTSRRLFDVAGTNEAQAIILATGAEADRIAARVRGLICMGLAGDALGGAAALLDMCIAYLGTRRQFDRPVAMFQALKHRVADLKCALDTAEAFYREVAASETRDLARIGAMKAHCCEVYKAVAEEAVQFHGGNGLTQEYPVHLFLKRAFLNRALGGSTDFWTEQAGRAALA